MRVVSRSEYYAFLQSLRISRTPTKLERTVHYIDDLEYIVEQVYFGGEQKAQAVELGIGLGSYIIIEG